MSEQLVKLVCNRCCCDQYCSHSKVAICSAISIEKLEKIAKLVLQSEDADSTSMALEILLEAAELSKEYFHYGD